MLNAIYYKIVLLVFCLTSDLQANWQKNIPQLLGSWESVRLVGFSDDVIKYKISFRGNGEVVTTITDQRKNGVNKRVKKGEFAVGKKVLVFLGEFEHPTSKKNYLESEEFNYSLEGGFLKIKFLGRSDLKSITLERVKEKNEKKK